MRCVLRGLGVLACVFLFLAPVASALNPDRLPTQYLIDHYQRADGLPSDTVWDISEGPYGYLWLATRSGLVRFDGLKFSIFNQRTHSTFSGNDVRALEWTPDGELWIGIYGSGLLRMRGETFEALTEEQGLLDNVVYDIHRAADGAFWITGGKGVSRVTDEGVKTFTQAEGLVAERMIDIAEADDGTLWFSSLTGGISRYRDDSFQSFGKAQGLDSEQIHLLTNDDELGIIAGTAEGGLFQLSRGGQVSRLPWEEALTIQRSIQDSDGNRWFGTYGHGLWRLTPKGDVSRFPLGENSDAKYVFDLHEDTQGNIWVATADGLYRIRDSRFLAIGFRESMSDTTFVVTGEPSGTLWVGTEDRGLFRVRRDGEISQPVEALSKLPISALLYRRNGELWVGTFGHGLYRVVDGRVDRFEPGDGLSGVHIYALKEMRDGAMWVGTNSGVDLFEETFQSFSPAHEQLGVPMVRHILQARDGRVWLSSEQGLYCIDDGNFKHLTTEDGLGSNVIISTYEDERGVLWIASREGEIGRFAGGELFWFGAERGLPMLSAFAIIEDRARQLWISSAEGLLRISRDSLDEVARGESDMLRYRFFDEQDGLRSSQFLGGYQPAAWSTPDNWLWFVTIRGLTGFDPRELAREPPSLRTYIEAIRVNEEPVSLEKPVILPASMRRLEIDFSAPELSNAESVNFRYTISDGRHWEHTGTARTASFNALPAGTSSFRVQAQLGDEPFQTGTGKGALLEIYRAPRWYETSWSVFIGIALLAMLIIGAERMMGQRARRREEELLKLVDRRTEELREALVRVEAHSRIDPLTGVANRRYMEERLSAVWKMAQRASCPVSVLMLDIDSFKQYNDSLGHHAGDDCLKEIATVISDGVLRGQDFMARYGGEEFLVLLYDTDPSGARQAAERLLERVRSLRRDHPASEVSAFVTISVGFATGLPTEIDNPHTLIDRADRALYAAKERGRNQVRGEDDLSELALESRE